MVSLKIDVKKKDLIWLVPLVAVLVVGVVYAVSPIDPAIHGHPDAITHPGAIVAFDLNECPEGWTELVSARGRTIVGLNPDDSSFDTQGEMGGEKIHQLTIDEMPSHKHTITIIKGAYHTGTPDYPGYLGHGNYNANIAEIFTGNNNGGDQPHNNLQPYISFIYCKKN